MPNEQIDQARSINEPREHREGYLKYQKLLRVKRSLRDREVADCAAKCVLLVYQYLCANLFEVTIDPCIDPSERKVDVAKGCSLKLHQYFHSSADAGRLRLEVLKKLKKLDLVVFDYESARDEQPLFVKHVNLGKFYMFHRIKRMFDILRRRRSTKPPLNLKETRQKLTNEMINQHQSFSKYCCQWNIFWVKRSRDSSSGSVKQGQGFKRFYCDKRDWVSCFFFEQYIQHFDQDPTHHYNMDEHMKCFIEKYHERGVDETVQAFKALNIFRLTGGRRCEGNFVPGYAMNFYNGRKAQRSIHMVEQYGNWTTGPEISNLSSDEQPLVSEFMPKLTIPGEPSPNGSTTGLLDVPMQVGKSVERLAAETVVPIHRKKRWVNYKNRC